VYEALAWGRHVNRIGDAWEAVRRADHPNVLLAVDTFHVLSRGDDASAIADVPGSRIGFLQIADAPRLDMNVLSWSRHHRCFPGQGDLDVPGLVGAVVDAGYRGPLSLEVFSDVVRVADPRMNALDGMRSLLHLEEALRTRRDAQRDAGEPVRAVVHLFDPPPLPDRVDAEFVEFAVTAEDHEDEDPATSVTALLRTLGFAHVATHATRAVQWWRNGEANVCVTTQQVPGRSRPRPFVSALALRVAEVRDVATRAEALLWPSVAYRRGRFTAALPGVDTPSGLHVFLSGPEGAEDDWRAGYPGTPQEHAHGDWIGIDHVGATVPAAMYPAEQSFYRSVFGLTGGTESEFMQPSGRLQSRPFAPAEGDLRVVLAVSDSPEPPRVGQIAFACPDVAAVVARARAAGLSFLPVPANYYDDLQARFDLDDDTVRHLRAHDLMYDEDDHGRLLHAYTPVMNGQFYVEILQRDHGYAGFGAPSTHVRLAAQARVRAAVSASDAQRSTPS